MIEIERHASKMIDLTSQLRLRFTGADRVRYLNGQVTNDVRKLSADGALWACVTNHKGKLEALISMHLGEHEDIFIDAPAVLRDMLPGRLEKYIIADDVTMEDVSESTVQVHLLGETCPPLPAGARALASQRYGVHGWDVWAPVSERHALLSLAPTTDLVEVERLRIEHGIPAWESELAQDIFPSEAGLETWAVDYHKGCYIGQEVISRLKSVGKVNRHLRVLNLFKGPPLQVGWELYAESPTSEKAWGTITSVSGKALGYVRREYAELGTLLIAGVTRETASTQVRILA
jgi:tRNA-modifying protein YgfZ